MRKENKKSSLYYYPALSLVKKIDSRAISRNQGSSSKEDEQSFKAYQTKLELLAPAESQKTFRCR